jgi:nucleoid-associated protein YgaU
MQRGEETPGKEPMTNEDKKKDEGMPDFSDVQSGASSTAPEAAVYETYEVKAGDSLSKIAKRVYGNGKSWQKIFDANKDLIRDPNKIFPGQKLKIPK